MRRLYRLAVSLACRSRTRKCKACKLNSKVQGVLAHTPNRTKPRGCGRLFQPFRNGSLLFSFVVGIRALEARKTLQTPTSPCVSNGLMTFWFQLQLVALTNHFRRILCKKRNASSTLRIIWLHRRFFENRMPWDRSCGMLSTTRRNA